ncbi:DUF3083 family protein [Chromatiaceae bacterium AAb-1]|nr:DUF3083 family protein [Chromatiaceae bacterium AAb-1]
MSFNRVYISASAKANQYILAEIRVTDELLSHYPDYESCFRPLSRKVFELADKLDLRNVHVITNDKLPVVRFSEEAYRFQTPEQILFFYNPEYHGAQDSLYKLNYRPRKIRLLFLATDTEIRANSAKFHEKVLNLLQELLPLLPVTDLQVKVRDHQHLSYDLFARDKGKKETYGYKLRALHQRYKTRGVEIPDDHSALTYAKVSLPLSRKLRKQILPDGANDYSPLYQWLEEQFKKSAAARKVTRLALLANNLTPIVRNSRYDKLESTEELQMIGFDPTSEEQQFISHWEAENLAESVNLILVAGRNDRNDIGYARFMNQVEEVLKQFAQAIGLEPAKEDMIVRFHQHISYRL